MKRFGWNRHVHVYSSLHCLSLSTLEHPPFLRVCAKRRIPSVAVLGHAVVLLFGAVVPQAPAVVPQAFAVVLQEATVVPLLGSSSTMSPGPAQRHKQK